MSSIIKVDAIQKANGTTPTMADLGLNDTGTVLNHYYTQNGTETTLSSAGFTDINLSFNITPVSTSSKFVIHYNVFLYLTAGSNTWKAAHARVLRDSHVVDSDTYSLGRGAIYNIGGTHAHVMMNSSNTVIDTPNTTSQITYKIQLASYNGGTIYYHQGGQKGILSITEIAG
jgi:hypothetical protein